MSLHALTFLSRAVLLPLFGILGGLIAIGQQGVGVSPPRITLYLQPGATKAAEFTVFTRKTPELVIVPSVYDWQLSPDGRLALLPPGTTPYTASKWIKIGLSPFDLSPRRDLRVPFSVTAPEIASGSYRTAVAFTTQVQGAESSAVHINLRVVAFVYVVVLGRLNPDAEIINARFDGTGALIVDVVNRGNVFLRLRPSVEVLDRAGQLISTSSFPEEVLLRGGIARLHLRLSRESVKRGVVARVHIGAKKPVPMLQELYAEVPLK